MWDCFLINQCRIFKFSEERLCHVLLLWSPATHWQVMGVHPPSHLSSHFLFQIHFLLGDTYSYPKKKLGSFPHPVFFLKNFSRGGVGNENFELRKLKNHAVKDIEIFRAVIIPYLKLTKEILGVIICILCLVLLG